MLCSSSRRSLTVSTFLAALVGGGLGCGDAEERIVSTRNASNVQCPSGGTVLLFDEEVVSVVCNGVAGVDGTPGINGLDGEAGIAGTEGAPGTTGERGLTGAPGPEGSGSEGGLVVAEAKQCGIDNPFFPFVFASFQYSVLSDGSVFASLRCNTDSEQTSQSLLFPAQLVATSSASLDCELLDDTAEDDDTTRRYASSVALNLNLRTATFNLEDFISSEEFTINLDGLDCSALF